MTRPLVVVGDALLDVDLVGTASRLTPDAPVPVVEDVETRERPGGAALAAVIAARATRREVVLVAPMADDEDADRLRALLAGRVRLVEVPATGGTAVTDGATITVTAPRSRGAVGAVVAALSAAGVDVADIAVRRPTLDEVYLRLVGPQTADGRQQVTA